MRVRRALARESLTVGNLYRAFNQRQGEVLLVAKCKHNVRLFGSALPSPTLLVADFGQSLDDTKCFDNVYNP